MIKYALTCDQGHESESWFRDSSAFDSLGEAGQLACPVCRSAKMSKALMAPSIVRGRQPQPAGPAGELERAPAPATPPHPPTLLDDRERQMRDKLREIRAKIIATADDVGRAFPEEARRIHDGDVPARPIYGEATGDEVRALLDEGVPLLPMPGLPDDHH